MPATVAVGELVEYGDVEMVRLPDELGTAGGEYNGTRGNTLSLLADASIGWLEGVVIPCSPLT